AVRHDADRCAALRGHDPEASDEGSQGVDGLVKSNLRSTDLSAADAHQGPWPLALPSRLRGRGVPTPSRPKVSIADIETPGASPAVLFCLGAQRRLCLTAAQTVCEAVVTFVACVFVNRASLPGHRELARPWLGIELVVFYGEPV